MKNLKNLLLFIPLLALFASCEKGSIYTGSPVDNSNLQIVTLVGEVSTPVTSALTAQKIPFSFDLKRTFTDTVRVEATTTSNSGSRRRAYVLVLPGEHLGTGEILAAGGSIFNSTFSLALTAIELYTVEPAKHYLLASNVINVNTGNTTIPAEDASRLQIKLEWPDASSSKNRLKLVIDRPDPVLDALPPLSTSMILHYITNVDALSPNTNGTSNVKGEFILKISAFKLLSTPNPTDLPYRIVVNHPEGKVEVFEGVYNNLFADNPATTTVNEESPLLPVLKITKTVGTDGVVSFSAVKL